MRMFFVLALVITMRQGQAQSETSGNEWDPSDPTVQGDESVANFNSGFGAQPKNKNSVKVNGVKLHRPSLGGNGCPEGTVGVAISPDNKILSVIFDNYVVQAGRSTGKKRDVKTCSVRMPLEVPAGFQFTVVKLDYRGYNSIPNNKGRTSYLAIYSFLDAATGKQVGRRIRRQKTFRGPLDEEYILSSDISAEPVWSRCGKSMNFQINTRAMAISNGKNEDVMGTIDSLDASVDSKVEYHLLWQACK